MPNDRTPETTRPTNRAGVTVGQCVTLACLLEATYPKPGNVHRGADFEDVTFVDFAISAAIVGPIFERAAWDGVGGRIRRAIEQSRRFVRTNTNLGLALLLGPLAAAAGRSGEVTEESLAAELARLGPEDATNIYQAIRLANPGGLGDAAEHDVHGAPPADILAAMRAAAERDLVARQYANGFQEVFVDAEALAKDSQRGLPLADAVIHTFVTRLSRTPDTLIARKLGPKTAAAATARAGRVIGAGPPQSEAYLRELADFDCWLRSDGHRHNPGATADLIGAALFVALWRDALPRPII